MASRGLIVAIEDYPDSRSSSWKLEGTTSNAVRFAHWLESTLNIPRENLVFCGTCKNEYCNNGATRRDITNALIRLIQDGANQTDRLIVYLSGHGVMVPGRGTERHTNVLLTADFVSSKISGDACVSIDEMTTLLSRSLGSGVQISFVDACRTADPDLLPSPLGINADLARSGRADWFQLLSTSQGDYAVNNSHFMDTLLTSLEGSSSSQSLERDAEEEGSVWVTFRSVAYAMERDYSQQRKRLEVRCEAESSDCKIRRVPNPGPTATILGPMGCKSPPLELLVAYEEVIFLGETNGQLREFLPRALEARGNRPWRRVDVLSVEDLSKAARPGIHLAVLESERQATEDYFKVNAESVAEKLSLYRYEYAGTYGSFWIGQDGRRRVHASPRILGVNIRQSPSQDFIDFPDCKHPIVDQYWDVARAAIRHSETRCIFSRG